jgi:hypothetical protein
VTFAFATAAPVAVVMVPVMAAFVCWAGEVATEARTNNEIAANKGGWGSLQGI